MGWHWQKKELDFEKQITTECVVNFYQKSCFLVFSSILNLRLEISNPQSVESVIHKRRLSEKFWRLLSLLFCLFFFRYFVGLVWKVNGLCHEYWLRLCHCQCLFGWSCHVSSSLWSNVWKAKSIKDCPGNVYYKNVCAHIWLIVIMLER